MTSGCIHRARPPFRLRIVHFETPALRNRDGAEKPEKVSGSNFGLPASDAGLNLVEAERELLLRALAQAEGDVSQAARLLGVSRDTVRYRIEKYGLKQPE